MGTLTKKRRKHKLSAHVGTQMLQLRRAKQLTQVEAARKAALSQGSWCDAENGRSPLSVKSLERVAECFGVHVSYFFQGF